MQPKLELTLTEYFESHKITYDLFSYYCPFPQEKLVFDLTLESNILNRIEHAQNSNNHVMIFSLPLNLLSLSPEKVILSLVLIEPIRNKLGVKKTITINNKKKTKHFRIKIPPVPHSLILCGQEVFLELIFNPFINVLI